MSTAILSELRSECLWPHLFATVLCFFMYDNYFGQYNSIEPFIPLYFCGNSTEHSIYYIKIFTQFYFFMGDDYTSRTFLFHQIWLRIRHLTLLHILLLVCFLLPTAYLSIIACISNHVRPLFYYYAPNIPSIFLGM